MASIYEPLLETLALKKEVTIAIDEEWNESSFRTQWHRYKKRLSNDLVLGPLVSGAKVTIYYQDDETAKLALTKKTPGFKIVEEV